MQAVWETVQVIGGGVVLGLFALSQAARRRPDVPWLQKFNLPDHRTEQQKRRARRSQNIIVGIEMIGAGLLLPLAYLFSTVLFFFSGVSPVALGVTILCSLALIGFGIRAIVKAGSP